MQGRFPNHSCKINVIARKPCDVVTEGNACGAIFWYNLCIFCAFRKIVPEDSHVRATPFLGMTFGEAPPHRSPAFKNLQVFSM